MSDAGYKIEVDARRSYLGVRFTRLIDEPMLQAFESDLVRALRRLEAAGVQPGHCLTLVDLRCQAVQPQSMVQLFEGAIGRHTAFSRRVAMIVSTSMLHKLQARRLAHDARYAIFQSESEARTWLHSS